MSSDALGILCIAIGVLVILARGPLIFAPERTLEVYGRMLSTDPAVRVMGLCIGGLGAGTVVLAQGGGGTDVSIAFALGLIIAVVGLMVLVFPSQFRGVVGHVLDFVRDSVDPGVVRALGGVAVGIGVYLVYFGARLL